MDGVSAGRAKLGAVPYAVEADHAVNASIATGALDARLNQLESDLSALASKALTAADAKLASISDTFAGDASSDRGPGYAPARLLFESLSADVVGVEVNDEGVSVASLPDDARLVYVTPSHQYPLGVPMSHSRRLALLRWAQGRNAVVIEDDSDSEFRFGGRPADALQSLDRAGCVVYVGEFSKTTLPSLRLGFLIAPESLQEALKTALFVSAYHSPCPTQAAMAEFIRDGLFARHIRKMRREYACRHDKMAKILERSFAEWLDPIPGVTGLHISAFLRTSVEIEAKIAARAEADGIGLHRLSTYYLQHRARPGLTLGCGGVSTERIEEGLRRLQHSIEHATASV